MNVAVVELACYSGGETGLLSRWRNWLSSQVEELACYLGGGTAWLAILGNMVVAMINDGEEDSFEFSEWMI